MTVETVTSRTIGMRWDPEGRLATIEFAEPTRAIGADAHVLASALTHWIGMEGRAFGLLGDGGKLRGVDADRAVRGRSFREHRGDAYVAFFGMNPLVRVVAEMFRRGAGIRLRALAHEADARRWLREVGIGG